MICPTCSGEGFEDSSGSLSDRRLLVCNSCARAYTYHAIRNANSERIEAEVSKIEKEVVSDLEKNFKDSMKKALRGSKNITFK